MPGPLPQGREGAALRPRRAWLTSARTNSVVPPKGTSPPVIATPWLTGHHQPCRGQGLGEFGGDPGLADSGLAGDQSNGCPAFYRPQGNAAQHLELRLAAMNTPFGPDTPQGSRSSGPASRLGAANTNNTPRTSTAGGLGSQFSLGRAARPGWCVFSPRLRQDALKVLSFQLPPAGVAGADSSVRVSLRATRAAARSCPPTNRRGDSRRATVPPASYCGDARHRHGSRSPRPPVRRAGQPCDRPGRASRAV